MRKIQCNNSTEIDKIVNLYLPKSLKKVTILNGIMPQFYLYNGNEQDSYWEEVKLEQAVAKTCRFTWATEANSTQGFNNTMVTIDTTGHLVGVIANNIELYNITLQTFYNQDGLLGFTDSYGRVISLNSICTSKAVTVATNKLGVKVEYVPI